ncbi:MAG: hypothetical protein IPL39_04375 [Opitutaceae bacterium]|nr:hypothetical protein [Opitutaceae bacterium]
MRPNVLRATLALLLLAPTAGCTRLPPAEHAAALATTLSEIRAQCPADPTAEQATDLAKPAKQAAKAYTALVKLQERHPQDIAVAAARTQAEPVYAEVRRIHRLATERHDLADLMGSLTVRGYRAARSVAVPKLLATFATAARQAATTDSAKLPTLVRQAAEIAALLADIRPDSSKFQPALFTNADWLLAAERIESFNRNEPPEFALGLGLAYALLGKSGLALVEFERTAPERFADPAHAVFVPLARAVVFSRLGFIELAALEASKISEDTEQGRQLLAAAHAGLAYFYTSEKDWKQVDRELALAVRAWPNNPLVVFLTGERLLADGRTEQALETLTRATAGTEGAWLAPLIEQRVRTVRDSSGAPPPLAFDSAFTVKCTLRLLIHEAKQSGAGRKLAGILEAAQLLPSALEGSDPERPVAETPQ